MNKIRRKQLQEVINELDELRNEIDNIMCEEQEAYDKIPENLNNSERTTNMCENIDYLEDAISNIEEIINNLEEILERESERKSQPTKKPAKKIMYYYAIEFIFYKIYGEEKTYFHHVGCQLHKTKEEAEKNTRNEWLKIADDGEILESTYIKTMWLWTKQEEQESNGEK